jgi:uncharacterized protein YjbI with pentapeptide repeats
MAAEIPSPAAETENPGAAFAKKAKDLEALRSAVIDAASVGAGLWLSYLFVLFYLAIAVGGVTHRNLLFESPVKLPFLNVDLPLVGFFVLGPGIFLIVHAYVLVHFVLLADKVGAFHGELQAQIADDDARARLRRQLPSNIFVQFLAGPREMRTGLIGFLLRLIAQISLVAGPLALLVFFQLQFLPYHSEAVSWWQRIAVVADLALLWALWPSVARGETTRLGWRDFRRGRVAACALASLAPVLLVFTIATFPGEWLDANLLPIRFVPKRIPASKWIPESWTLVSPHELLVQGDIDSVARKPTGLWSNRLVLPGFELSDQTKSETDIGNGAPTGSFSLRGRHLEGAVLIGARLRKADLMAAQLKDADLTEADLREAKFECGERLKIGEHAIGDIPNEELSDTRASCAELEGARLERAHLQGASFSKAHLQGARFDRAELQGASFAGAQLTGAQLNDVDLQDAILQRADLQGASLRSADLKHSKLDDAQLQGAFLQQAALQGASLVNANLQGASLQSTSLQGVALDGAHLQGAELSNTYLQGASLAGAELQGARLYGTHLQGASLAGAQLQGAWLQRAELEGASLDFANLQGALFDQANLQGAVLRGTQLQGARFGAALDAATIDHAFVWRTPVPFTGGTARIVEPITGAKHRAEECRGGRHIPLTQVPPCDWRVQSFAALKQQIEKDVPKGERLDASLKQIETLDPDSRLDDEEATAKAWADLARGSPALDIYEEALAKSLLETGCNTNAAPYVIRGLLRNLYYNRFQPGSPQPARLAAAFLDEEHCPGAHDLSEEEKIKLRALAPSAAKQ